MNKLIYKYSTLSNPLAWNDWYNKFVKTGIVLMLGAAPMKNCIGLQEYYSLHPEILGIYHKVNYLDTESIKQRLDLKDDQLPLRISAIAVFGVEPYWDIQSQVICDLLSSDNGSIGNLYIPTDHIPVYFESNESLELLRITIENTYELLYHQKMKIINI